MARYFLALVSSLLAAEAVAVTPEELESFFYSSSGLDMRRSDAHSLALQEAPILTQCNVAVDDLRALWEVLYSPSYLDWSKKDGAIKLLPLAKQHINPSQLKDMYGALYSTSSVDLPKSECGGRTIELVKYRAEPEQVKALFNVLYKVINLGKKEAQVKTLELAAAGCDPKALQASYSASRDLASATSSAVRANLNGEAKRFAKDGKAYSTSEFQQFYSNTYMSEWMAAPLDKRVAKDGAAYSASEFRMFYASSWESYWHDATPATQLRIAEDGKTYTVEEFVQYYKDSWQQTWSQAPEVPCKECRAQQEVTV